MLKIKCKSDYNIVEQLGNTSSKISMLSLLKFSEALAKAYMRFFKSSHVPEEIFVDQFENCVASLTSNNGISFNDANLTPAERNLIRICVSLLSVRAPPYLLCWLTMVLL